MTRLILTQKLRKTFTFYNDPPAVPPVSPPPPPPPAVPPVSPPPPPGRVFTQEEVNRMMADHKRTLQENNTQLVAQLEELRKNSALTQQQRDELDSRIQVLSQQHLTEQQKLQLQLDQATKKAKTEAESLAAEAKQWRGAFEGTMIENAVLAGSAEHKAVNAGQLLDLLRGKAKVVQDLDASGQPTGKFLVKLPVKVVNPKTKATEVLELDAVEAIGKMREDPSNGNLFMFDGKTGLGGTNHPNNTTTGDGAPDFSKMTPAQYQEWRKKNLK